MHALVLGGAGECGRHLVEAAIEARVNYVDLISEPSDEHRERAREAGILAISGLGMSPGTTNVLCAHAAKDFDELRECYINFASFRTIAPSPGLLDTILWELSDDCPTRHVYQDAGGLGSRRSKGRTSCTSRIRWVRSACMSCRTPRRTRCR